MNENTETENIKASCSGGAIDVRGPTGRTASAVEPRMFPAQAERVESGPVQFGDDWPGVFFRGDTAFGFCGALNALLADPSDQLAKMAVAGLADTLASCDLTGLSLAASPSAPADKPEEMSPDFTDSARAALMWVLWHHQGGSSDVGQAMRFALGMGQFDRLSDWHIAQAKTWAAPKPGLAHEQQPAPTLLREAMEALKEARRAIGDHSAPDDCYATGPMTGDPIRDLVQCPACSAIPMIDAALVKLRETMKGTE